MFAPSILILAAGKGERMRSETPKALQPLAGQSLLTHLLETARVLRPKEIAVLVGHKGAEIRKKFSGEKGIRWAVQKKQLGTAHALLTAWPALKNRTTPLFILYVDVPLLRIETLKKMSAVYAEQNPALVLLTAVVDDPTGYGRIVRNDQGQDLGTIERIVEEKEATETERGINEINTGIYLVNPQEIFPALQKVQKSVAKGEYYLTDLVANLLAEGKRVATVMANDSKEVLGINTKEELAVSEKILQQRIKKSWMEKGVTLIDPDSVWIGATVKLAPDVVILPHCVIEDAVIEAGARIGPFAHIRPGSIVRAGAHVGNFVELKKTTLGKGAKANHLSYLGDSEIGAGANIGAGTITCNYDGLEKHKTVIGDGAFIGSDTQLVAPVKVGKNAWVGAGTTVTKNVPPKALALSRVEQVNIQGWRRKKK